MEEESLTYTFRCTARTRQFIEELAPMLFASRLRKADGKRLKKQELIVGLVSYAHSIPFHEVEKILEIGLNYAKIPLKTTQSNP